MDKKPIGFMSYARTDDSHENGKLSAFRERLSGEVRMQSGDMDFDIFQDHLHIAWGQKWEQRLDDALDSVKLLIPIITPMFSSLLAKSALLICFDSLAEFVFKCCIYVAS